MKDTDFTSSSSQRGYRDPSAEELFSGASGYAYLAPPEKPEQESGNAKQMTAKETGDFADGMNEEMDTPVFEGRSDLDGEDIVPVIQKIVPTIGDAAIKMAVCFLIFAVSVSIMHKFGVYDNNDASEPQAIETVAQKDASDDPYTIKTDTRTEDTETRSIFVEDDNIITGDVIISDRIDYNKLIIGREYTFKGVLVDRETNKEILIDGKPVTVEKTITADKKTGYVYLEFKFNGSGLKKDDIIIHEVVEKDGVEIANMVQDVPVIFDM